MSMLGCLNCECEKILEENGCLDQFQGRAEGWGRESEWISVGIKGVKEPYYLSIFV